MKKITLLLIIFSMQGFSLADGSGWVQTTYMARILEENIRRYRQLQSLMTQAKNQNEYLKMVHAGLENSIGLLSSIGVRDEGVLSGLWGFKESLNFVSNFYGKIPRSDLSSLHTLHDKSVAESFKMINLFKKYADIEEKNSERLAIQGRKASPKGAARMQIETNTRILKSLGQLIRLNAQMLKLQSESVAFQNKKDKDNIHRFQKVNRDFSSGFKNMSFNTRLFRY